MKDESWWDELLDMDGMKYQDVLHALLVRTECGKCGHFNTTYGVKYPCNDAGSCISATLAPEIVERMRKHLGWVN